MLLAKFSDIPEYKISQTYTTVVLSVWLKYAPIYGLNYIAKKKKSYLYEPIKKPMSKQVHK